MNELKKLLAEATPGTWSVTDEHEILSVETCNDGEPYENRTLIAQGECSQNWGYIEWFNLADAALIVAAVNALPELLEKVKRYDDALDEIAAHYNGGITGPGRLQADSMRDIARAALKETGQ